MKKKLSKILQAIISFLEVLLEFNQGPKRKWRFIIDGYIERQNKRIEKINQIEDVDRLSKK